jgi:hypothetical protein
MSYVDAGHGTSAGPAHRDHRRATGSAAQSKAPMQYR